MLENEDIITLWNTRSSCFPRCVIADIWPAHSIDAWMYAVMCGSFSDMAQISRKVHDQSCYFLAYSQQSLYVRSLCIEVALITSIEWTTLFFETVIHRVDWLSNFFEFRAKISRGSSRNYGRRFFRMTDWDSMNTTLYGLGVKIGWRESYKLSLMMIRLTWESSAG